MRKNKLLDLKNVIGHAEVGDIVTVFVTEKIETNKLHTMIADPNNSWQKEDFIPKEVKTSIFKKKKTDVIQVGKVKAMADSKKYRPMVGGCEIGTIGSNWVGTLGMPVKMKNYNGLWLYGSWYSFLSVLQKFGFPIQERLVMLTNSHVVNDSVVFPTKKFITQPGGSWNNETVGRTIVSVTIDKNSINEIDAAIVETAITMDQAILLVGQVTGTDDVLVGEGVEKYGRTTLYTEGTCVSKNVTMTVNYHDDGDIVFKGLDMFSNMCQGGDSGSVIVRKNDKKVVSHLFAGSDQYTFGAPIKKVQNSLKFEVV